MRFRLMAAALVAGLLLTACGTPVSEQLSEPDPSTDGAPAAPADGDGAAGTAPAGSDAGTDTPLGETPPPGTPPADDKAGDADAADDAGSPATEPAADADDPTAADAAPETAGDAFTGRIAVSADGNIHDRDDWGATAATLAIFHAAGVQDALVHYDYSSHIGESTDEGEQRMTRSALGSADRFGYDPSLFFDGTKDLQGAIDSIAAAVNASTADDPLYFLVAGPMEVAYRGIAASDEAKRQHVLVVSHSGWNNTHTHPPELTHTADDVKALGVQFEQLPDQNGALHSKNADEAFTRFEQTDDPDIAWVVENDDKRDISDSGMAYWLVTGNDRPSMDDLAALLTSN